MIPFREIRRDTALQYHQWGRLRASGSAHPERRCTL